MVPHWHGKYLHEHLENSVEPLWIKGAGHNDFGKLTFQQYCDDIAAFVKKLGPEEGKLQYQTANASSGSSQPLVDPTSVAPAKKAGDRSDHYMLLSSSPSPHEEKMS